MGDYLLEEVTDAEGEAFPAEAGSGNEVEGRLPVQGQLPLQVKIFGLV